MPFQRLRSELPRHERFANDALLELIQALGWIRTNDSGIAVIAPAGDRILSLGDGPRRLRRALLDYVEVVRPPWTMLALDGRKKMLGFAPIEFGQSMTEAYLAEGYDDEVIEFWDRLAAIARGQQDIRLSSIGRDGERLTLSYEKRRTGHDPIWRSIESNSDGYDVMSVVSSEDHAQRQIEVKASTLGLAGSLHLTRNEWDSTETMVHHTFHLWDLKNMNAPQLAIVARAMMDRHVPYDNGAGTCSRLWPIFRFSVGSTARSSARQLVAAPAMRASPRWCRA
jgi:hypothetical protein